MDMPQITQIAQAQWIELHAIDQRRNIARRYVVSASADLFGAIVLDLRWGRVGARGQMKRLSFDRTDQAVVHINAVLRRRAGARRRCGCDYRRIS